MVNLRQSFVWALGTVARFCRDTARQKNLNREKETIQIPEASESKDIITGDMRYINSLLGFYI